MTRGLFQLYRDDPDEADHLLFGRVSHPDRRGFLQSAGLAAMGVLVGGAFPFHRTMPAHFLPVALAGKSVIRGKDGLTLLNERPLNAETPPHLLDDAITPTARHFVRNNGIPPESIDPAGWRLTIDGLVETPMTLGIDDLRRRFEVVTAALTLECAGNGRAFFDPPATGAQWTYGAVACAEWTGVRLADVLRAAGLRSGVVYTAHEGADTRLSGEPGAHPISRGVPIAKATDPGTLVAFAQNGRPIHPMNGAPLRLVVPGWPGSCSQKWLTRVWLRDRVYDGAKMTGTSYRVPRREVAPGEAVDEKDFVIIEAMPVKSLITSPASGHRTGAWRCAATPGPATAASPGSTSRSTSARAGSRPRSTSRSTPTPGRTGAPLSRCRSQAITRSGPGRPIPRARASPTRSSGTRGAISTTRSTGWR